jgi:hypothetical protein
MVRKAMNEAKKRYESLKRQYEKLDAQVKQEYGEDDSTGYSRDVPKKRR